MQNVSHSTEILYKTQNNYAEMEKCADTVVLF